MSNKELLPCPFCGGEADIHTYEDMLTDKNYTEVVCGYCGVGTKGDTQSEAIDAWNTRNYPVFPDSSNSSEKPNSCKKSCKDENTTCKKNLQLTRSDIEKMVKPIEWEDYNGEYNNIYACSKYMGDLYFEIKSANRKTYWVGVDGMCNWLDSSVSKCKQQAQLMLVDIICSALGVEE